MPHVVDDELDVLAACHQNRSAGENLFDGCAFQVLTRGWSVSLALKSLKALVLETAGTLEGPLVIVLADDAARPVDMHGKLFADVSLLTPAVLITACVLLPQLSSSSLVLCSLSRAHSRSPTCLFLASG